MIFFYNGRCRLLFNFLYNRGSAILFGNKFLSFVFNVAADNLPILPRLGMAVNLERGGRICIANFRGGATKPSY